MSKENQYKKSFSLISILASLFVYIGAIAIYFYANGWRLGNVDQFFIKTGVLTVESEPFLATLYVEGDEKGRTPKSVSLPVGIYDISVYRSGYVEWKKTVEIKDEKSTPVYPWLVRENIAKQQLFTLEDKEYIDSWTSEKRDHTYFLASEYDPTSLQYTYSLYRFDLNTSFWDLSSNPEIVLTFSQEQQPEIDILLSPNGRLGVLTIATADSTTSYLLDPTRGTNLQSMPVLNIGPFSAYDISWSNDNSYLIFESGSDLVSFDIEIQTRYLLLKKSPTQEYFWSTDEQGFFYKITENPEEIDADSYSYILTQEQMDGSSPIVLVQDLFFQKNTDYIKPYRDDTGIGKYAPFTNSPESTKSVGKLKGFSINQNSKGIYIQTETSSYWYNIDTKKYHLVSPYPSELVEISPDNYSFIFKDTKGYWVFTYEKEEGDHTITIGAKQIDSLSEGVSNISWLSNPLYVSYIKDGIIYLSDKDGDNETMLVDETTNLVYFAITNSNDKLLTISLLPTEDEKPNQTLTISSYTIH